MSLCPLCRRALCDHTAEERKQTEEGMMKPLTESELEIVKSNNNKILEDINRIRRTKGKNDYKLE